MDCNVYWTAMSIGLYWLLVGCMYVAYRRCELPTGRVRPSSAAAVLIYHGVAYGWPTYMCTCMCHIASYTSTSFVAYMYMYMCVAVVCMGCVAFCQAGWPNPFNCGLICGRFAYWKPCVLWGVGCATCWQALWPTGKLLVLWGLLKDDSVACWLAYTVICFFV